MTSQSTLAHSPHYPFSYRLFHLKQTTFGTDLEILSIPVPSFSVKVANMSAFAEAMAAQKAQQRVEPPAPPVAIRGQARAAASAIRAAVVGNTPQGERMDVDGNSKNRRGAQVSIALNTFMRREEMPVGWL